MGYGLPRDGRRRRNPDRTVMLDFLTGTARSDDAPGARDLVAEHEHQGRHHEHGCLGMVRQWQSFSFHATLPDSRHRYFPDFLKLAEAYGAKGLRATKPEELESVLAGRLRTPGVVVMDVIVSEEETSIR